MEIVLSLQKLLKNQRGNALLYVLLIFTIFTVLGASLAGLSFSNLKMNSIERHNQSAYYIAEAGIVEAMGMIEEEVNKIGVQTKEDFFIQLEQSLTPYFTQQSFDDFEPVLGIRPKAIVQVKKNEDAGYTLISKGIIGSNSRTLKKDFRIQWEYESSIEKPGEGGGPITLPEDLAVLADGKITLNRGAYIQGHVATTRDAGENPVVFSPQADGANIFGQITYNEKRYSLEMPEFPDIPSYTIPKDEVFEKDPWNKHYVIKNGNLNINKWMVDNYTLTLSDNLEFNDINLNRFFTLIIDVGEQDRSIVVNNLNIENGHIKIIGNGKLAIYVKGNIIMGSGSSINTNNKYNTGSTPENIRLIPKLNIFLAGTGNPKQPKKVKLAGNQKIFGSLFAEDADIELNEGGGFQGHIITGGKSVTILNGGHGNPAYIFATNADIHLDSGGTLYGTAIGKNLKIDNGGKVVYKKMDLDQFPLPIPPNEPPGHTIDLGKGKIVHGKITEI